MSNRPRKLLALGAVIALVAGACSSTGSTPSATTAAQTSSPEAMASASAQAMASATLGHIGGTVTVYGTWSGSEQDSFLAMRSP